VTIRFVRSPAGMVELLLSPGVKADLERRANAVRDAAEADGSWDRQVSGVPGDESIPYRVRVERHGDRNVAQVSGEHPASLAVEAKHRVLGRAIDAAR
jgi:hypothetical protein